MDLQKRIKQDWSKRNRRLQVEVSIRFGNPKYEDCRNFGICKMELITESNVFLKKKNRYAHAVILKVEDGFRIFFVKRTMTEKTMKEHFAMGFFIIEKEKKEQGEIAKKLEVEVLFFEAGRYEVFEDEEYFMIKVTS